MSVYRPSPVLNYNHDSDSGDDHKQQQCHHYHAALYERALHHRGQRYEPRVCRSDNPAERDDELGAISKPHRSGREEPREEGNEAAQASEEGPQASRGEDDSGGDGQEAEDFFRLR